MNGLIATSNRRAVIGAGITGRSVARFLTAHNMPFDWFDTRASEANLNLAEDERLEAPLQFGEISDDRLCAYDEIILSPGLAKTEPYVVEAENVGAKIIGDIELFARHVEAPVATITGSNGKSSVTTLLAEVAKASGVNAVAAGNLGKPALDQLGRDFDLYVLELSSFQLETTFSLKAGAAVILNMSPDHMDRYASMIEYHAAKRRIHIGATGIVTNRDDLLTQALSGDANIHISFGFDEPDLGQYGLRVKDGSTYVARGLERLFDIDRIKLRGRHNLSNALAVLAMAEVLDLNQQRTIETILAFRGLPHRCELVQGSNSVIWINDSKATNAGAAIAAIKGMVDEVNKAGGQLILIAGGQSKDQNFTDLGKIVSENCTQLILMGEDADQIAQSVSADVLVSHVGNMQEAVWKASQVAGDGDCVLLSPACASFDQFDGYEDRGNQFRQAVEALG